MPAPPPKAPPPTPRRSAYLLTRQDSVFELLEEIAALEVPEGADHFRSGSLARLRQNARRILVGFNGGDIGEIS